MPKTPPLGLAIQRAISRAAEERGGFIFKSLTCKHGGKSVTLLCGYATRATRRLDTRKLHRRLTSTGCLLKLLRIVVSAGMLAGLTLLLTTLNASLALKLGWMDRIQIAPLTMATSLSLVAIWMVASFIFGRFYCSSVCPLGTVQDFFSHLRRGGRRNRRRPFHYAPPRPAVRYAFLASTAATVVLGTGAVASLLDPYSEYARMASDLLRPLWLAASGQEVVMSSAISTCIAAVTFLVISMMSFFSGRSYCNTVCPIGTVLGLCSRYSLYHFDIDTDICTNCRKCEHVCKSQCINLDDHVVDGSRCVVCFNCVAECPENAIRYTTRNKRLSIPMMQQVSPTAPTAAVATPGNDHLFDPETDRPLNRKKQNNEK